jgi:membrane-associated protease RseP (regulator of RpoE activity)
MRTRLCSARLVLAIMCVLSRPALMRGQPTYLVPVQMKGQVLRGSAAVAQQENEGMIGINGKGTEDGYDIETVTPGFPAAIAGILPGDIIASIDGSSTKGLDTTEIASLIAKKQDGEILSLTINRNGVPNIVAVRVGSKKRLLANDPQWQEYKKFPPAVGQFIFGRTAAIQATLFLSEQYPNDAFLGIHIESGKDAPSFTVDDTKLFVLDGTGQQLRHVSLDEIKYQIQVLVAQNWKGGNYPPPPPPSPQRQYTISGIENGNYTITNLGGGMGSISGTSTSTYTVTQQPDYSQLGYSLGLAIRKYRDTKSNQKLLEQANEATANWEGAYFKSLSPIVAGENRSGQIMYWTGSTRRPQPPYRVVLFISDPRNQTEEHITFAFGPGAEKIKEGIASQSAATDAQPKAENPLTNSDVVGMVKAGIGVEIMVAKIKTATCSFDTSPAALKELKDAGVPDSVILAMVQTPKS